MENNSSPLNFYKSKMTSDKEREREREKKIK